MDYLTHYIVLRRDLPLGVMLAQTTHAAGESFYLLNEHLDTTVALTREAVLEKLGRTRAVVLGARNENRLKKLEKQLLAAGVPHVAIREPDEPWNGQLMALGIVPANRDIIRPFVEDFQTLRGDDENLRDARRENDSAVGQLHQG